MLNMDWFNGLYGKPEEAPAPQKPLKERWADFIEQQQNGAAPAPTGQPNPISFLTGFLGGAKPSDNQGFGQPGPPAPIDYKRMQAILNSGVLRPQSPTGTAPAPAPVQAPSPPPPRALPKNPIEAFLTMFGRR